MAANWQTSDEDDDLQFYDSEESMIEDGFGFQDDELALDEIDRLI